MLKMQITICLSDSYLHFIRKIKDVTVAKMDVTV